MKTRLVLSASLLLLSSPVLGQIQPRATVENGVVVGHYGTSQNGKLFQRFEGIPYAKPPIGQRRFKEPERLDEEWIGEWNATTPGSPCMQYDHFTRTRKENGDLEFGVTGDEDCLFLNVYTRDNGSRKKNVIVFVHGGAFMFGSSTDYGPEYLMDNDNLVYVTMNYRLGPLGFLTTGDYVVPGNNGLKDQTAALEWVQRNVAAFGGDPKKVSLVGLSAGGASVHFHFLSPLSKGLFTKGYSYSGTTLCPWVLVKDGVQKTKRLAAMLGCPTSDSKSIVKCLRRRPARKVVALVKHFQSWLYNPFTVFGPVVEVDSVRPFINKTPLEILRNGEAHDVPWVSGYTTEDGLYPCADFIDNDNLLRVLEEKWEELAPDLMFYSEEPRKEIARKLKEMYLGREKFHSGTVPQIVQMYSDRLFVAPAIIAAVLQARANKSPVYLYQYGYVTEKSVSRVMSGTSTVFGACHGDDMAYVVKFYNYEAHLTKDDKAMAHVLNDILMTYVETGAPPKALNWEPVSRKQSKSFKYLNVMSPTEIKMEEGVDIGNIAKWEKILGERSAGREEL